ncbi:MAG: MlaD family protein [Pelovirga sp.]
MDIRKKVDPRVIGIFVIGAIILVVAGLLFFGPGGFFSETRRYVIYFENSVKGLSVGSPVRFRGVRIGQVKEISIEMLPNDLVEFHIPVVIELELEKIKAKGSGQGLLDVLKTTVQGEDPILPLVAEGLRAQLHLDSLVTGQLFVHLDMFPAADPVTPVFAADYPQIPAVTSSLAELTKTFEDLPLQQMADKLIESADGVQRIFTSPALHRAIDQFDTTTELLNQLLANLNERVPTLLSQTEATLEQSRSTMLAVDTELAATLTEMRQTLDVTRQAVGRMEERLQPLGATVERGLHSFDQAATDLSVAMEQVRYLTDSDSPLLQQFSLTLKEMNRTMRGLRYLADEIERDPQVLLRGRALED